MQKRSQDDDEDKSCHQIGYKRREQHASDRQLCKGVCHQVASEGESRPLPRSAMLLVRIRHAATSDSIESFRGAVSCNRCAIVRRVGVSRLTIAVRASSANVARGPSASCTSFASQRRTIADRSKQESISARARLSCAPPTARNCPIREAFRNVASSGASPFWWIASCTLLRASATNRVLRSSSETGGISVCAASSSDAATTRNREVKRKLCGL